SNIPAVGSYDVGQAVAVHVRDLDRGIAELHQHPEDWSRLRDWIVRQRGGRWPRPLRLSELRVPSRIFSQREERLDLFPARKHDVDEAVAVDVHAPEIGGVVAEVDFRALRGRGVDGAAHPHPAGAPVLRSVTGVALYLRHVD